jgi:signal transduction histidine kinase
VRLLGLAAVTITVALAVAWVALTILFERHVKRRVVAELANHIIQIAANLDLDEPQLALLWEPADPRFRRPFGGLYWQVEAAGSEPLRSRSLWDEVLPPPPAASSIPMSYEASGPQDHDLILRAETLRLPSPQGERSVQVLVGVDRTETERAIANYSRDLAGALTIIGICLAAAAAFQVGIGLAPLASLRNEVAAVRTRRKPRLDPDVPREVRPLVVEMNDLLAAQDEALFRARARASDLAHGLKTPLTVLSTIARGLRRGDREEAAAEIVSQVEMMRRRIDRQLARARLGVDPLATSRLDLLVERLVAVMARLPGCDRLAWDIAVAPECAIAADEVDVAEAVGNVLDNACKWARSNVRVAASAGHRSVVVVVEDDGPGVPEDRLNEILARGLRLDTEAEGSGLGLTIVQDIVAAYQGGLDLSRSSLGGLSVRLEWPRAALTGH